MVEWSVLEGEKKLYKFDRSTILEIYENSLGCIKEVLDALFPNLTKSEEKIVYLTNDNILKWYERPGGVSTFLESMFPKICYYYKQGDMFHYNAGLWMIARMHGNSFNQRVGLVCIEGRDGVVGHFHNHGVEVESVRRITPKYFEALFGYYNKFEKVKCIEIRYDK